MSSARSRRAGAAASEITQAPDDVNIQRAVHGQTDRISQIDIQISDPTDSSVGVCNLSAAIELITGDIE